MSNDVTEHEPQSQDNELPSAGVQYTQREIITKRIMFVLGIVVWVLILSIPLILVSLSIVGEFSFQLPGDYPDNRLRVWMVMEPRERGFAYSLPLVIEQSEDKLTVETNVRYMLWEGEGEHVIYCQRYNLVNEAWSMSGQTEGECNP